MCARAWASVSSVKATLNTAGAPPSSPIQNRSSESPPNPPPHIALFGREALCQLVTLMASKLTIPPSFAGDVMSGPRYMPLCKQHDELVEYPKIWVPPFLMCTNTASF